MREDELFRMVFFGILAGSVAWNTYSLFDAEQPVLRIAAAGDAFSAQADQCTHLRRSVAAADLSLLYILHCHGTV